VDEKAVFEADDKDDKEQTGDGMTHNDAVVLVGVMVVVDPDGAFDPPDILAGDNGVVDEEVGGTAGVWALADDRSGVVDGAVLCGSSDDKGTLADGGAPADMVLVVADGGVVTCLEEDGSSSRADGTLLTRKFWWVWTVSCCTMKTAPIITLLISVSRPRKELRFHLETSADKGVVPEL
jgi:hypothetical protein